jgi:hypothetical protein
MAVAVFSPTPLRADLVNVGDSQLVTLHSWLNGDPRVDRAWGVPIQVTAGTYHFHLENSYWNFGIYGRDNEAVGGVTIYDTNLVVVASCPFAYGKDPNVTVRDFDFDVPCDQTLLAGVMDNYINDNAGDAIFTLTKTANPTPPQIVQQPKSVTASPGASAAFVVAATGKFPIGYQWRFNDVAISDATNTTLTLQSVTPTAVGFYDVVVSNVFGTVLSERARLALLDVKVVAALFLDGPIGSTYQIEWTPSLSPTNWQVLTNVDLPTKPYVYIDFDSFGKPERLYRAKAIP